MKPTIKTIQYYDWDDVWDYLMEKYDLTKKYEL